jgi:hypothetical protein
MDIDFDIRTRGERLGIADEGHAETKMIERGRPEFERKRMHVASQQIGNGTELSDDLRGLTEVAHLRQPRQAE